MLGLMTWLFESTAIVWPSFGARTSCCVPTMPPAAGMFSTVIGWPSALLMCVLSKRARMSPTVPTPAATMTRIGCDGYGADCAAADVTLPAAQMPIAAHVSRERSNRRAGTCVGPSIGERGCGSWCLLWMSWSRQRTANGLGVGAPVLIQTLLTCRYSLTAAMPFSRPIPESL